MIDLSSKKDKYSIFVLLRRVLNGATLTRNMYICTYICICSSICSFSHRKEECSGVLHVISVKRWVDLAMLEYPSALLLSVSHILTRLHLLYHQPSQIVTLPAFGFNFSSALPPPFHPFTSSTSFYADECAHLWKMLLSSLYLLVVVAIVMLLMRNNVCGKIRFVYFTNDWFRRSPPTHDASHFMTLYPSAHRSVRCCHLPALHFVQLKN